MKVLVAIVVLAAGILGSVVVCSRGTIGSGGGNPAPNGSASPVDQAHFSTQPATGVFADGGGGYTSAQCAAALDPHASSDMYNGHPINQETIPQNQQSHLPGLPA